MEHTYYSMQVCCERRIKIRNKRYNNDGDNSDSQLSNCMVTRETEFKLF